MTNPTLVAQDIVQRLPAMQRDSAQNNICLVSNLIMSLVTETQRERDEWRACAEALGDAGAAQHSPGNLHHAAYCGRCQAPDASDYFWVGVIVGGVADLLLALAFALIR